MSEKSQIDWHGIIQDILDDYLPLMSGKKIKEAAREYAKYFLVDYYCLTDGDLPEAQGKKMVRPFDHLKERNIIEYKSINQVVNERTFRDYIGRSLVLEGSEEERKENYQGKMTLTILTSHKPEKLIGTKEYAIERLNDWKYQSHWIKDLEVYILVQKGMRGKKEGEAMAFIQVLEGEKEKQIECWGEVLNQNLDNALEIKRVIEKIGRETYMNLIAQAERIGIKKGIKKGIEALLEVKFGANGLSLMEEVHKISDLEKLTQFQQRIKTARSIEELRQELR